MPDIANMNPALFYLGIFLPALGLFFAGVTALLERIGGRR